MTDEWDTGPTIDPAVGGGEAALDQPGDAPLDALPSGSGDTVQYFFPVEVEVRAAPDPVPAVEIVDLTLDALAAGLEES